MEFMISEIWMSLGVSPLICSTVGWAGRVREKLPGFPTWTAHRASYEQCLSAEALAFWVLSAAWHSPRYWPGSARWFQEGAREVVMITEAQDSGWGIHGVHCWKKWLTEEGQRSSKIRPKGWATRLLCRAWFTCFIGYSPWGGRWWTSRFLLGGPRKRPYGKNKQTNLSIQYDFNHGCVYKERKLQG